MQIRYATSGTFQILLICILGAATAFAFQLNRYPVTFFEGEILPADNDAFYHARRILDTVQDPGGFYQFDTHLRAPHGMLLPWPWGYDFAVASIVRLAISTGLTSDPLVALAYVPPFAAILSIALVALIAQMSGLGRAATALLVVAVATSPLTQALHGLGSVDHHFAEYLFILGFLASSLAWLKKPSSGLRAGIAGLTLGLAPAIHTLLFILQVPALVTLGLLWLRRQLPDERSISAFVACLMVGTIFAVTPSQAFREGLFEHYYLDWFHVYVASCTSLGACLLSRTKVSPVALFSLSIAAIVLLLPLVPQLAHAAGFLSDDAGVLHDIGEAKSLWRMASADPGHVIRMYSALVLLVPAMVLASWIMIARARDHATLLIAVYSALALPMLLTQFRFYYYGSIALMLLPLLLFQRVWQSRLNSKLAAWAAGTIACVYLVAQIPSLHRSVVSESIPGRDPYFLLTRLAMPALRDACRTDPGIVLAKNNDGRFIRYYTDCSVISDNFLIAPEDMDAFYRVADLFGRSPEDAITGPIPIKYILVRSRGAVAMKPDGSGFMLVEGDDARRISDPLTDALLWSDASSVDSRLTLVAEIPTPTKDYPYARIWKVSAAGSVGGAGRPASQLHEQHSE